MSLSPPMPPYNSTDPTATFLSSSALDFLLIELVPLAHRIALERDAPVATANTASNPTAAGPASDENNNTLSVAGGGGGAGTNKADSTTASHTGTVLVAGSTASGPRRVDEEEHLDAVHYRLEAQGYRVGQGLVERFSKDRPRFNDTLDVIKFICKDLWSLVFGKNIDNLKTNHRGVYVLTDNVFRPFSRMSTETGSQAVLRAQPFLWFPCGIVRGALAALGINATVQAEVNELPGAVFQIKTLPTKP